MKKSTNFLSAILMAFAMAVPFSFTSCGDDDDDPKVHDTPKPDNIIATVEMDYSISLAQTYFDFFDVTVEYTDKNGKNTKETLTSDWTYNASVAYDAAPETVICKVTAVPKKQVPEIESGKDYDCNCKILAKVSGKNAAGVVNPKFGLNGSNNTTGSKSAKEMSRYITREHSLLDYSYAKEPADI